MARLIEPTTDTANPGACPSCESDILNVHGIHTCSTCNWVAPEYR